MTDETPETDPTIAAAWEALLAVARRGRAQAPLPPGDFALDQAGTLGPVPEGDPAALLRRRPDGRWIPAPGIPPAARDLFELYLPVCSARAARPVAVGHLGQSLDGHIATDTGDSCYVTGPENILHLHRMRALCDAVVVGAGTVAADDPRLTTRLVAGDDPVRVILDPQRRLSPRHEVFTDGRAPTLLVCSEGGQSGGAQYIGHATVLQVPARNGQLDLAAMLTSLRQRGMHAVFIEGGGKTVSRFLEAGLLDRLQVAVAPLIIGSGRPGVRLPCAIHLRECLRPPCLLYRMGGDVLFDCDLRSTAADLPTGHAAARGFSRIR